jgi:hypothetical protein
MKAIQIKGHNYIMVNERVKEFREKYANWSLISEIVAVDENSCIIKASVIDENGVVKATGYAQEDRASSMINKTSYIENCETSAWGRALANLGIGIDESIASAEEVNIAIAKQEMELDDYVFQTGKYAEKDVKTVLKLDRQYIEWVAMKSNYPEAVKSLCVKILEQQPQKEIVEVEV